MVWGGGESFKLLLVQFVCLGKTHKTHACSKIFNPIVDVGGGGGRERGRERERSKTNLEHAEAKLKHFSDKNELFKNFILV